MNKHLILSKLGLTERGALFILRNWELCRRIEKEEVISVMDFVEKYSVPLGYLQRLMKMGAVSHFSNSSNKGATNYLFEEECVSYLCQGIYHLGLGLRLTQTVSLYMEIIRDLISERDYSILTDMLIEHKSVQQLAVEKGVSSVAVQKMLDRAYAKVRMAKYIKSITGIKEEHETLKWEIEFLKKQKLSYLRYQKEHQIPSIENRQDILQKSVLDCDFSNRVLNCFRKAEINTIADLVKWSKSDLLKIRNFRNESLYQVEKFYQAHNLTWKQ